MNLLRRQCGDGFRRAAFNRDHNKDNGKENGNYYIVNRGYTGGYIIFCATLAPSGRT